jgi:hypothetical protein
VNTAREALSALFAGLSDLAKEVTERGVPMTTLLGRDGIRLAAYHGGRSITAAWSQQWANTLDHSTLYVMMWDGEVSLDHDLPRTRKIAEHEYGFDISADGTPGWRMRHQKVSRFFSSATPADHLARTLLNAVTPDLREGTGHQI